MIKKECKIILQNKCVLVIDFDGKKVQLSNNLTSKIKENFVYVKFENKKYTIIDEKEFNRNENKYNYKKDVNVEASIID